MEIDKIRKIVKYPIIFHYNESVSMQTITMMESCGHAMVGLTHTIDNNCTIIHSLSVDQDQRKRGIGKYLIRICEKLSKDVFKVKAVKLYVEANTWQYMWYVRLGFKPEETIDEKSVFVLMKKDIQY